MNSGKKNRKNHACWEKSQLSFCTGEGVGLGVLKRQDPVLNGKGEGKGGVAQWGNGGRGGGGGNVDPFIRRKKRISEKPRSLLLVLYRGRLRGQGGGWGEKVCSECLCEKTGKEMQTKLRYQLMEKKYMRERHVKGDLSTMKM